MSKVSKFGKDCHCRVYSFVDCATICPWGKDCKLLAAAEKCNVWIDCRYWNSKCPEGHFHSHVQQGTSSQEHMVVMSDNVGTGYLPTTSSPPASASIAPLPEAGSPNVATSNVLSAGGLATARVIRAEQKKFFFDLGSNARGQYLRISEVRSMIQRKWLWET